MSKNESRRSSEEKYGFQPFKLTSFVFLWFDGKTELWRAKTVVPMISLSDLTKFSPKCKKCVSMLKVEFVKLSALCLYIMKYHRFQRLFWWKLILQWHQSLVIYDPWRTTRKVRMSPTRLPLWYKPFNFSSLLDKKSYFFKPRKLINGCTRKSKKIPRGEQVVVTQRFIYFLSLPKLPIVNVKALLRGRLTAKYKS